MARTMAEIKRIIEDDPECAAELLAEAFDLIEERLTEIIGDGGRDGVAYGLLGPATNEELDK